MMKMKMTMMMMMARAHLQEQLEQNLLLTQLWMFPTRIVLSRSHMLRGEVKVCEDRTGMFVVVSECIATAQYRSQAPEGEH